MFGITKHGDPYLRSILIHGAALSSARRATRRPAQSLGH